VGGRRYTAPETLAAEFEHIWPRVWQLACLDTDLPEAGDYCEYEIGPYSVIVVREPDGSLRAFHNVCQHRGRKLVTGTGNLPKLQCPYHSWTWSLDGTLESIPERETFCPFTDDDVALRPVRVDQWNHWVFVNLDPDAPSLAEYLGGLADRLEPYRYERQYKWRSRSTVVRANWKNLIDAFNEAYHARSIHPESVPFIDYTDYEVGLIGDHSYMVIPFGVPDAVSMPSAPDVDDALDAMEWSFAAFGEDTSLVGLLRDMHLTPEQALREVMIPLVKGGMEATNVDVSGLTDDQLIDDWHFYAFPNVVINSFSFGYWLFRIRPHRSDPTLSHFDMWYFHRVPDGVDLPPDDPDAFIEPGESCGAVMDQDFDNVPIQQDGMASPVFAGMRLSSLEARIAHMHAVLDRYLDAR
jgi:nitrite reductase/ring-hydroxylating ferredoxin subunit